MKLCERALGGDAGEHMAVSAVKGVHGRKLSTTTRRLFLKRYPADRSLTLPFPSPTFPFHPTLFNLRGHSSAFFDASTARATAALVAAFLVAASHFSSASADAPASINTATVSVCRGSPPIHTHRTALTLWSERLPRASSAAAPAGALHRGVPVGVHVLRGETACV